MKNKKYIPYVLGSLAVVALVAVALVANNGQIFQGSLTRVKNMVPSRNLQVNPAVIKPFSKEPAPAPKLVFNVASTPSSSIVQKGSANVPLYGMTVSYPATAPSPFTVTAITFLALIDNDTSGQFAVTGSADSSYGPDVTASVSNELQNLKLYSGSTLLGNGTIDAAGQVNFAPITLTVAPGTTQALTVRADVKNGFDVGAYSDRVKLAMFGVGGYGINADYSGAMNGVETDGGVIQTIAN